MKLMMTTAITAALIATGSFAETASRGADNATSAEKVEMGTQVDATADANLDKASRGEDDVTAAEAEGSAAVSNDEVAGTQLDSDDESRGADNLQSEEVATGMDNSATGGAAASGGVSASDSMANADETDATRGADEERSEEVADGEGDTDLLKAEEGEVDASRGEDQARATDEEGADVSDTMTSDTETSSRGADNVQGQEVAEETQADK